jgi:hypothetical protein
MEKAASRRRKPGSIFTVSILEEPKKDGPPACV